MEFSKINIPRIFDRKGGGKEGIMPRIERRMSYEGDADILGSGVRDSCAGGGLYGDSCYIRGIVLPKICQES